MKNNITYEDTLRISKGLEGLPEPEEWALNRLNRPNAKLEFDACIAENKTWIRYFEARQNYELIVMFKERILILEKAWIDYQNSGEVPHS